MGYPDNFTPQCMNDPCKNFEKQSYEVIQPTSSNESLDLSVAIYSRREPWRSGLTCPKAHQFKKEGQNGKV